MIVNMLVATITLGKVNTVCYIEEARLPKIYGAVAQHDAEDRAVPRGRDAKGFPQCEDKDIDVKNEHAGPRRSVALRYETFEID